LRAAVEVEVEVEVEVVGGGEVDMLEVVELEVGEKEKNVVVEDESSLTVEEKPTKKMPTSTLTPVEVTSMCSEEDDDEAEEQANIFTPANYVAEEDRNEEEEKAEQAIDLVDGASAYHYFTPHLPPFPIIPHDSQ
jgi:hypothetical protein